MIKIAYIIDTISSDKAGTEKQLLEIIKRLNHNEFDPILICLSMSQWLDGHALPCRYYVLNYSGFIKLGFPGVIAQLMHIIRVERFDIIQTFFEDSIFVGFLSALLSSPRPILLSSRRDMGLGKDDRWYHFIFKSLLPIVNRSFDGIVANGEMIREYVSNRERTCLEKIKVINNGIELPPDELETPEIFQTIKAEIWIGVVANLKPVKRIDVFLEGLAVLMKRNSFDFHAIILGEGMEEFALKNMAQEIGISSKVHFMGSVNNVYSYLKHLDIGVLCSDREGFSNAVMEYMASGLPVVATAVGGNTELVDDANGILVAPGDGLVLGEALVTLLEDSHLRRSKGITSLQRIKNQYAWDRIIKEWESYYRLLIREVA